MPVAPSWPDSIRTRYLGVRREEPKLLISAVVITSGKDRVSRPRGNEREEQGQPEGTCKVQT